METLILLCIISVVLNIAIYPLCKIKFRDEDAQRIAEGKIATLIALAVFNS